MRLAYACVICGKLGATVHVVRTLTDTDDPRRGKYGGVSYHKDCAPFEVEEGQPRQVGEDE